MDLMSYITGTPSGTNSPGFGLMDRFMNPVTMAGLAMVSGKDPAAAANFADQMQQRSQQRQMAAFLVQNAPAEEKAMALLAPSQYVAAKMGRMMQKPMTVKDDEQIYDPSNGSWTSPPGGAGPGQWTPDKMRKEYDYANYTPESVQAAEEARDPSLLQFGGPAINKEKIQTLNTARGDIEPRLAPIRQGMNAIQIAQKLLNNGGGAADYAALVSFVKSADPGTAAREGEVDAAQKAAGYLATIGGISAKMQENGGFMSDTQKAQMHQALNGMRDIYRDNYEYVKTFANDYSKEFNLPEHMVLGPAINFGTSGYDSHPDKPISDAAPGFIDRAADAIGIPLPGRDKNAAPAVPGPTQVRVNGGKVEYSQDGKSWSTTRPR